MKRPRPLAGLNKLVHRPAISQVVKEPTAGGIVFRRVANVPGKVDILLIQDAKNRWTIPKGHIEEGEDAKIAAIREIEEESGILRLNYVKKLGSYVRYKIGLDGRDDTSELKHIHMFLFTTDEQKPDRKSLGMTITKERLNVISQSDQGDASYEIIDLKDDQNKSCGTKVVVKMPLIFG